MEGGTPPKTSLLSQKLPGGQALINNIQEKLRHATSIRDLIIAMESKVHTGVISLIDLVAAMEEYGVYLDKRECDVLDRRFTNASGCLEYFRLIKTLDIGNPTDHMDPEHFEDILPQPYRMISKILEYEIMDVAWLEILRKHPEVAEDIPGGGGAGAARRNRNLDRECHPSCQVTKTKQVAMMGGGEGPFAFSVNVEGSFQVMNNATGKVLRTLQLFPLDGQDDGADEGVAVANPTRKDGSLVQRVEMSNTSIGESPHFICRTAVLRIESNLPKVEPEEDAAATKKGKKNDKKAAVTEEKPLIPFKCSITIVETSGKTSNSFETRVLNNIECMLQDSNVNAVLSQDGRVLTVSHGMTVELFKLIPMTEIIDPFNNVSAPTSHSALVDIEDEDEESMLPDTSGKPPCPVVPPSLCQWNIQEEIIKQTDKHYTNSNNPNKKQKHLDMLASLDGSRVWRSFIFPILPRMQWNDTPLAVTAPVPETTAGKTDATTAASNVLSQLPLASLLHQRQQRICRDFQNGMVVFLEDVNAFFVFGLRNMTAEELASYEERQKKAMDEAILAAGGNPEEGNNPNSEKESPLLNNNPPFLELITFWSLSAAVTAIDTDPLKSVLVFGQADGVVTMWDLRSLQMVDVPARHHNLVTAVALTSGAKTHSLISGDVDGTLCFCNLAVPNAGKDGDDMQAVTESQTSSTFVGMSNVQQCVKAELIDFRTDFTPKEVIANIYAIPLTAIVIIQLESMKLVAYDAETAELYGRVSLTSGIPGQRIQYSMVPAEDAVLIYTAPPLTEEEKERLRQEAEEEAAKAAKGKKGKKEPVQEEVDLESLVTPEPSPYLVRKNRTGICCSSAHGFCGSFIVDNETEVISTFSTERLITFFCVGVESILQHMSLTHSASFDQPLPPAVDVYRALSKEERNSENLKPNHVASLQGLRAKDEGSATLSKHTASTKRSTARGTSSQSNHSNNSNNNVLTEAKLKALQKTYSPFEYASPLPGISAYVKQKVPLPRDLFEKSSKQSQSDRARRKKALLSRMDALSGMV